MKATEKYFPVVLFIMLYKAVPIFKPVNKILKCDHSNENYWAVLSCGTLCYVVQGSCYYCVCGWKNKVTIQMTIIEQHFAVVLPIMRYKVVLTIVSLDEILKCDTLFIILYKVL